MFSREIWSPIPLISNLLDLVDLERGVIYPTSKNMYPITFSEGMWPGYRPNSYPLFPHMYRKCRESLVDSRWVAIVPVMVSITVATVRSAQSWDDPEDADVPGLYPKLTLTRTRCS